MPRPRSAMRQIRDVLRLKLGEGLSRRQVARAVSLPYTTVANYLERASQAGLGWPLPEEMDDWALEARLFKHAVPLSSLSRPQPDWTEVHRELRLRRLHPGVIENSGLGDRIRRNAQSDREEDGTAGRTEVNGNPTPGRWNLL